MSRQRFSQEPRVQTVRQLQFPTHGGARKGAGRKPAGVRARVSHATRPALASRFPVLVTLKLEAGQPSLRRTNARDVVLAALAAAGESHGMRAIHYSIQSNHIHALVEARDARALSRGMLGLAVRIARGLNRLWKRTGRLWSDRYHARILRTPREVRRALAYVLQNARKHGVRLFGIDPFSSASAFDGWDVPSRKRTGAAPPVSAPLTWLMRIGWMRHGRVRLDESPRVGPRSKLARAGAAQSV